MFLPTFDFNGTDVVRAEDVHAPLVPSQLPGVNSLTVPYRLEVRGAYSGQFLFKPVPVNAISNTHKLSQNCANRKIYHAKNGSIGNTVDIPLISCDLNSTALNEIIEELHESQVQCALFYSNLEAGCALNTYSSGFKKSVPNTFTMLSNGDTIQLLSRIDMEETISTIYKTSALSGLEIFGIVIACIAACFFAGLMWLRYTKRTIHVSRSVLRDIPLLRVTTNSGDPVDGTDKVHDPATQPGYNDNEKLANILRPPEPHCEVVSPPRALQRSDQNETTSSLENPPEYFNTPNHACQSSQRPESEEQAQPTSIIVAVPATAAAGASAGPPGPLAAAPASASASSSSPVVPLHACSSADKLKLPHHWNFFKHSKQQQMGTYIHGEDDICPICLEEFQTGDILRQLPCNHYFHAKCVDPWLLKSSTKCPICRGDVLSKQKTNSEHSTPADANHHNGFTYTYVRRNLRRLSRTLRGEHTVPEPIYTGQVGARPSMSRSNTMPGRIRAARH